MMSEIKVHDLNVRIRYIPREWIILARELHHNWIVHEPENRPEESTRYGRAVKNLETSIGEITFSDQRVYFKILKEECSELIQDVEFFMHRYYHLWCLEYLKQNKGAYKHSKVKLELARNWFYFGPAENDNHFMNEMHGGHWLDIPGQASHIFNPESLPIIKGADLIIAGYSHPMCLPAPGVFAVYKPLEDI